MIWTDSFATALSRGAFSLFGKSISQCLSILIFHRVRARADALFPHEPDAQTFDRLMRLVARSFRVLTLSRAADLLATGGLPPRALVITFDDGYADNADVALPILQRHGLFATFFVSTGFLDGGRMWNDSIIECVRTTSHQEIDLTECGFGHHTLANAAQRRACVEALLSQIKYLDLPGREGALRQLQRATAVQALPTNLMMSSEEVRLLHRAGMEIGAHTVNHPILTALNAADAERELADGRAHLQDIIDAPVSVVAYPNGKPKRDFDRSHVAMVERLGFLAAVTTAPGAARTGDDLFQLPRFTPWARSLPAWSTRLLLNRRQAAFDRV